MGVGGGGGPQAESREPRLQQQELGAGKPLTSPTSTLPTGPHPSPPATSTLTRPPSPLPPHPHLEQLPGEVSAFIEALQVPDEVSAGHALPNVLSEGTEACEGGLGPQALKSLDVVCFLGSLPPAPHSHGRGDRC